MKDKTENNDRASVGKQGKTAGARAKKKAKAYGSLLSNVVKPADMTLRQWQIKLREQEAFKVGIGVVPSMTDERPGLFFVYSHSDKKNLLKYAVDFHGDSSEWNHCECMDFKTSGLGTCKHIEAVRQFLTTHTRYRRRIAETPQSGWVVMDYSSRKRCVRFRHGVDRSEELEAIISAYFDTAGFLKSNNSILRFLAEANEAGFNFYVNPEVYSYVAEERIHDTVRKLACTELTDELIQSKARVKLYPYQVEGVRFSFSNMRSIIADEMGLGKTIQAIVTAELLKHFRLATSVLIVCPTSLKYQWQKEIEKFTGHSALVIEGNMLKRRQQYEQTEDFYKIVSYNAISNDIRSGYEVSTDLLVYDEVQRLKNWDTQIARSARKIKSTYVIALSGTPLENKLEELYSVVELVDQFALSPYYDFRDRYISKDEAGMTIGYKNLHEVRDRLSGLLLRRRKCEVAIQMPERQDKTIYVEMTREQADMHNEFSSLLSRLVAKWRTFHFLSEQDHLRILTLMGNMRMIANSSFILDQKTRFDTKVEELMNILSEVMENGDEKVVVFSSWERMTRVIAGELQQRGIGYASLNGKVPSAKRKHLVDDFQTNPQCRVFLSTDAGATGLNLQAGSIIINMDLPWNPAVLEQRIGRVYRLGQNRNVQVINFVSAGSIEEHIQGRLIFKSALFSGIFDDGEETVELSGKKRMEELMEVVEEFVDEQPVAGEPEDAEPQAPAPESDDALRFADEGGREVSEPVESIASVQDAPELSENKETLPRSGVKSQDTLIKQGVDFLSNLAETLQSPERTSQLLDTLVKTDKDTGQSTLQIPVPSKDTVRTFLTAFSALLCGKKQ